VSGDRSGYEVARLEDIEPVTFEGEDMTWRPVRHHFGIHAFGVNAWTGEEVGHEVIEDHDEAGDPPHGSHEELYFVATGRARFFVDGEEIDAPAGTFVFVGDPTLRRRAVAQDAGTTVLSVGAPSGFPFTVSPWELRARGA
jgi:mannose-6-phosphate isomerase-like protein (cupin superfamily)